MDLLDVDSGAVRRVDPPQRVWVDLAAALAGRRPTSSHAGPGMALQSSPGLLVGWVRSIGHGWMGVVEVMVQVDGQEASVRMLVPERAVTKDSLAVRRRMGGKTSNRPTLRERTVD